MRNTYKVMIILLLSTFFISGCTRNEEIENQELSNEQKLEDFEYLFDVLNDNYPFFEMNNRINGKDWIENRDDYINQIQDTETDLEFNIILNSIVENLNYKHTQVLSEEFYAMAVSVYKDVAAEPWVEVLEDTIVQDRYEYAQELINNINVDSTYVNPNNLSMYKWPEWSGAYIKINSFNHFNIESDWKELQPFLDDLDGIKSLIIDIRGNSGGDDSYWQDYLVPELIDERKELTRYYCFRGGEYSEDFIKFKMGTDYSGMNVIDYSFYSEFTGDVPEEIKTDFKYYIKETQLIEPADGKGYQGIIYILTDSNVISSSVSFVKFMSENDLAYFIGEPTSGEGAGFDPLLLRLPNSGFVVRFPGVMVLDSSGQNVDEVVFEPDIFVDGYKALDKAKELVKSNNE